MSSEPVRVEHFAGRPPIQRVDPVLQWVVEPVVRVDEIQVAAGLDDPAEARLPAEHGALRVVLDVVYPCDPRAELQLRHDAEQPRLESALFQLDSVPFPARID